MARTTLTPFTALGAFNGYAADAANVVPAAMTGSAGSSGNQWVLGGNDLVIVEETGGGVQTITFTSVNCVHGRTGDIAAYSLGANEFAVFGAFNVEGWRQTDLKLYFEANSANVKIVIVRLP